HGKICQALHAPTKRVNQLPRRCNQMLSICERYRTQRSFFSMFQWLFGARRKERQAIVDTLYERIVASARRLQFFEEWLVPDTPLGRFEILTVHFFLVLRRLRGKEGALGDISQELTDQFFLDLDHSMREFGIGDTSIPKRMKKFAK